MRERPGVPVAVVPGVPALLPERASLEDPVADLRAACLPAVAGLGPRVRVVGSPLGTRVGAHLVRTAGSQVWPDDLLPAERSVEGAAVDLTRPLWCGISLADELPGATGVLVVVNGSAKRTEKAPGHFDERAEPFDELLRELLVGPDPAALAAVDTALAEELWADVDALPALAALLAPGAEVDVTYDDAPYGVQYWVISYS